MDGNFFLMVVMIVFISMANGTIRKYLEYRVRLAEARGMGGDRNLVRAIQPYHLTELGWRFEPPGAGMPVAWEGSGLHKPLRCGKLGHGWPSATPTDVGLDPKVLNELDADIMAGKYGNIDSMLIIRHGKAAFDRSYKHDYDQIYREEARTPGPLNAHDPSGPYNYFNPWWHPFYRRGDLHSLQSVTKTVVMPAPG